MKHQNYFVSHLADALQDRFDLTDEQIDRFLECISNGKLPKTALKDALNGKNRESTGELLNKMFQNQKYKEFEVFPVSVPSGLSVPMATSAANRFPLVICAHPAFAIPVSDEEKAAANQIRESFYRTLKTLEEFHRYLKVFFDHADNLGENENLNAINGLIRKYTNKLKRKFNEFTFVMQHSIRLSVELGTDPKMEELRDLIIESAKNIRHLLVELLKLFGKLGDQDFLTNAKSFFPFLDKAISSLVDVIRTKLFDHIDRDIMGKIKIGNISRYDFPLTR
jgi:hypothetical protein